MISHKVLYIKTCNLCRWTISIFSMVTCVSCRMIFECFKETVLAKINIQIYIMYSEPRPRVTFYPMNITLLLRWFYSGLNPGSILLTN